ncbi:UbiA prenyltransferase family-domain-containing protein [Hypoxylon sp. FL0543]|nr:UbiA prenyltransferase family-domain-containing protein [Hypoxylon sp. FL0543]
MANHCIDKDDEIKLLPHYSPPKSGLLSRLPTSWVPFAELSRIDRPTGIYLFYFPHLFGTLYVACESEYGIAASEFARKNVVLLAGTVFFRAAACSWNDNMDREYDRQVRRCRLRPLARGAVSPNQAHAFTAFLSSLAIACLYVLPKHCWFISMPSIILLALYPFAKRYTDYPQVILGLQVGMGLFMGMGAVKDNALEYVAELLNNQPRLWAAASFYAANVCWTIIYDTVYAQQDVEDDTKAGVRSMAVRFHGSTKRLLWLVSVIQCSFLLLCGYLQGFGQAYISVTCGGTIIGLGYMILTIDLTDPTECSWWFKNGSWFIALSIVAGLSLEGIKV